MFTSKDVEKSERSGSVEVSQNKIQLIKNSSKGLSSTPSKTAIKNFSSGWIYKLGSVIKTWKCVYISAFYNNLEISAAPNHALQNSGLIENVWKWSGHEFGFCLKLRESGIIYFHTNSAGSRNAWLNRLKLHMRADNVPMLGDGMAPIRANPRQPKCSSDCEGWIYKRGCKIKTWKKRYASLQSDGMLIYRDSEQESSKIKGSGWIRSVEIWDDRPYGLIFYLDEGREIYLYTESSSEQEKWISSVSATAHPQLKDFYPIQDYPSIHSSSNLFHSGWLKRKNEVLGTWKKMHCTLRGSNLLFKEKITSLKSEIYKLKSVEYWNVKPNGLAIETIYGSKYYVCATSYEESQKWFKAISSVLESTAIDPTKETAGSSKDSFDEFGNSSDICENYATSGWFKHLNMQKFERKYFEVREGIVYFTKANTSYMGVYGLLKNVRTWDRHDMGVSLHFCDKNLKTLYLVAETPEVKTKFLQCNRHL